jgi:quinol monooxygenase YgiN
MLMEINRRTLLAGGAALAAAPWLVGETVAEGIAESHLPKGAIILTAIVKAKPGQEEAVKKVLVALVEPTRKEPGCLCYNLHQSKSDKTQFMFYEQWASKEALDTHSDTPHLKALGGKLAGKTETGVGVTFYELLK